MDAAGLGRNAVHLSIDMQRIFAPGAVWSAPWIETVRPHVHALASRFPERTIFTRFVPPPRPEAMPGTWGRFYRRWIEVAQGEVAEEQLRLAPELEALVPPAEIIDKPTYSAFASRRLRESLVRRGADTLIVSGTETDMCVLASVLAAIDLGYRVLIVRDAVCSSADPGHDAIMTLFHNRFAQHAELVSTEDVLSRWQD